MTFRWLVFSICITCRPRWAVDVAFLARPDFWATLPSSSESEMVMTETAGEGVSSIVMVGCRLLPLLLPACA